MKFQLVFENSGDSIPFVVIENHELFEYFLDQLEKNSENKFISLGDVVTTYDRLSSDIDSDIHIVNQYLPHLIGKSFDQLPSLDDYTDQEFLLKSHAEWAFSQRLTLDIDEIRSSTNPETARVGSLLHDMYPDEIRKIRLAEALTKLGVIDEYERINMGCHWIENLLRKNIPFYTKDQYTVFDNPFVKTMVTNNGETNFNIAATYLGRKYYDQFICFNDEGKYTDHYNFERLEYAFDLNLCKPQRLPFSPEFLEWCKERGVPAVGDQIPVGNIEDISYNTVFKYSKIILRNIRYKNKVSIELM